MPGLQALLGAEVLHLPQPWNARRIAQLVARSGVRAIAGWGRRPSTQLPRACAARLGLPFIALEDGFVRSWGTGATHPGLSLVVDGQGIYYDATQPSALETLLASAADVLAGSGARHAQALHLLRQARWSKYNFAPDAPAALFAADGARARVLVVDQTAGDASISCGLARAETFAEMLAAARRENPGALIYIKTHPEVSLGGKSGHYPDCADMAGDANTRVLRTALNPYSVLAHMQRVYTVTSHLGFEALLAGVPVTCFGMPWYAGWGATQDRLRCPRRTRQRTVQELFAAACLHYTRYLNPYTHARGTLFDVFEWLGQQRHMAARAGGKTIAIGYRRWKAANVAPFLSAAQPPHFVADAAAAAALHPGAHDRLVVWGAQPAPEIQALAARSGAPLLRMEDGFIRSVGLGSDFMPPRSLVLDGSGIYFDPRQASDLETILNTHTFTDSERLRAARLRACIVQQHITKYNSAGGSPAPAWQRQAAARGQTVIFVPGQVDDDASIRLGCFDVRSNLALLRAVRTAQPDAFIVYKPHPDVLAGNRTGQLARPAALQYADAIEAHADALACIAACDAVHTMTSLTGFDALLRGKPVTVWGRPFYAGWGLSEDRLPMPRRVRRLGMDELVAGTLLHYPLYWDADLHGFTSAEATIAAIVRQRQALLRASPLTHWQRLWRKAALWARAGFLRKK